MRFGGCSAVVSRTNAADGDVPPYTVGNRNVLSQNDRATRSSKRSPAHRGVYVARGQASNELAWRRHEHQRRRVDVVAAANLGQLGVIE